MTHNSIYFLIAVLFFANAASAQTPAPGTYDFEGTNASTPSGANNTSLSYSAGSPSYLTYVSSGLGSLTGGTRTISYTTQAGSKVLTFGRTSGLATSPTVDLLTIKSTSGNDFRFNSLNVLLNSSGSVTLTFTPYLDGNALTAYTQSVSSATAKTAVTFPRSTFSNIDEVRISGFSNDGISVDDIIISTADTPPSAPIDVNAAGNTVPENSATGTTVGITASSTDPQGATITYSLTNSASGRFTINSSTGIVTVSNGTLLDYETTQSHQITVQASDGFFTSTANFTIGVTNVNEAPVITSNGGGVTASISVPENTTAVTTVTATDPESNPVTFSISGGADASGFSITSAGILTFTTAPDYENPTDADANNTYIVKVRASDNGIPSLYSEQTITVTVTDTDDGFFGGYAFRKKLTLNTSSIVSGSGTLSNFPLLLQITDSDLIYTGNSCTDKIQSPGGNDIAFTETDNSGTELSWQLESYTPSTGKLLVWVKLPSVTKSTNKTINIYFGNPTPPSHPAATGTWSSDYIAVFHFNDGTYSGTSTDATANVNTITASGMSSSNFVPAKIGNGYSFGGSQKFTSNSTSPYNSITSAYTLSVWVNPVSNTGDQKFITNQAGTQAAPGNGYKMGMNNMIPEVENRAPTLYLNRPGNSGVTGSSTTLGSGTWYYVQGVYSGGVLTTYVNGVERQKLTGVSNPGTGSNLLIGVGEGGNSWYYNGLMDEVRISNVAKSADWLLTEYNNQSNPSNSLLSTGSLEFNSAAASTATGVTYTWKGISTDISNANNWNNTTAGISNQAPVSGKSSWIIPAGLTKYPVLTSDFSIAGLTVQSGASVNLNGFNLNVFCNISNNGTITDNNSTNSQITFNGAASQTYTGNLTDNSARLGKLEVNNSGSSTITLAGGSVDIYKLVTITKGTLASNGFLRLKSGPSTVSGVAPLLNGASITGNVNVEVYFTGGDINYRGNRIISPPINESGLASKTYAQLKSYAVITGPGGVTNGFDPGNAGQPYAATLYKYNEPATLSQSQFTNVASIGETISPGNGVLFFFRGSRDGYTPATSYTSSKVNAPYSNPENVLVTLTGPINSGAVTVNLSYTNNPNEAANNGYNLAGNPYPAIIDWEAVTKVNMQNELKFIKPGGGYATYLNGISANAGGLNLRYIQPGQGFYARANAGGASLTFSESNKSVSSTPVRLMSVPEKLKVNDTYIPKLLRMNLQDDLNKDETVALFEQGRNANAGIEDASFFGGSTVSLASLSKDNKKLAINYMPSLDETDELKLSVNATATSDVKLNFTDLAAVGNYEVLLEDSYLSTTTNIKNNPVYAFRIDKSVAASYGDERLKLLFKVITLPVKLVDFAAKRSDRGAEITWTTLNETNNSYFEVERSVDGKVFTVLGRLSGKGSTTSKNDYQFTDMTPVGGYNYYRLKQVDFNGAVNHSEVVAVNISLQKDGDIVVFPNPAESFITVKTPPRTDNMVLSILDMQGKIHRTKFIAPDDEILENVSEFNTGTYIIRLVSETDKGTFYNSKFIKK